MKKLPLLFAAFLSLLSGELFAAKAKGEQNLEKPLTASFVDAPPTFRNKPLSSAKSWVLSNIQYSDADLFSGVSGTVVVGYIIEVDGSVSNIEVLETPSKSLGKSVERAVKRLPNFEPAIKDGSPVRYSTKMPIGFKIRSKDGGYKEPQSGVGAVERIYPLYEISEMARCIDGRPLLEYMDWIVSQLDHPYLNPESKEKGMLNFSVVIEKDGSVTNLTITKSPNPALSRELERVVKSSPKLSPAMRDGKPVRYRNSASMPLWKLRNWDEMSYTALERKNMAEGKPVFLDDVDILPTYNGSTVVNMYKDVMKLANENLPDDARSDSRENVKVSFSLGTDCSISNIDIVESPNDRYSQAAIDAVKSLTGRWSAAELYGEKVVVKMNVLVPFPVKSELGKAVSAISKDGQTMAKFGDGGLAEFRSWVLMNIKYPIEVAKEKIEGRVVIEFMVEMDGSIKQTNVMQSPDLRLSDEVTRVVKRSPKWSPATKDGKPVRIKYIIPVDFRFQ